MKTKMNMKTNNIEIGTILDNGGLRYLVMAVTPRRVRTIHLGDGNKPLTEQLFSIWRTQINGRGGAPTSYRGRQNYTVVGQIQS